jgi:hypothetical protein
MIAMGAGEQAPQDAPVNMLDTPLSEWGFANGVDDDVAAIMRSNIQAAQEQTGPYGDRVSSRQGGNRRSRIPTSASSRNADYAIDSQVRQYNNATVVPDAVLRVFGLQSRTERARPVTMVKSPNPSASTTHKDHSLR